MHVDEATKRLQRAVRYWRRCVESEDMLSVELSPLARTRSCVSTLGYDPFIFCDSTEEVQCSLNERLDQLAQRVKLADGELYYGYPILLYRDEREQNERIAPLLITKLEIRSTPDGLAIQPEETAAEMGITASTRLGLRTEEAAAVSEEISRILSTSTEPPYETAQKVISAISAEASINVVEAVDPRDLQANRGLSRSGNLGLYNRAVFFEGQNTAFNRALIEDLSELERAPSLADTALSYLIQDEIDEPQQEDEVPPLLLFEANEYQIAGLRRVLSNQLSVVTGPPGTGKSQFISNLLLNLMYRGKSALLVSHTNEAVQVVYEKISRGFLAVVMRTGNKENRQELPGRFRALLSAVDRNVSATRVTEDDLRLRWQRLEELRDDLVELAEAERRAEESFGDYRRSADRLGKPEIVDLLMRDKRVDFDSVSNDYHWIMRMRRIIDGEIRGLRAFFATLFPRRAIRRIRVKLDKVAQALPGAFWALSGHAKSTGKFVDLSDRRLRLIPLCMEVRGLFDKFKRKDEAVREYATRQWIESEIDRRMGDYAEVSKRLMLMTMAQLLKSRSGEIGRANGFLSSVAGARANDIIPQLSASVQSLLPLWACTLKSIRRTFGLKPRIFDYVIFDEASQVDMPSAAAALFRAKNVVVVGDPMQLTHISTLTHETEQLIAKEVGIDRDGELYPTKACYDRISLYRSAEASLRAAPLFLAQHYRSHFQIISLCNEAFYSGRLNILTRLDETSWPRDLEVGLNWVECVGTSRKHEAGSRFNLKEIEQVVSKVEFLVNKLEATSFSMGIVTPFSMQRRMLAARIEQTFDQQIIERHQIKVLTAHQFQGSEKDIMIFSPVVSQLGDGGSDRWFDFYPQILNVALSRARRLLYIVGDYQYCLSRPGILGKIAKAYSDIQKKTDVEEQSILGHFDTPQEESLFARLSGMPEFKEGYKIQPKRVVGPHTLDIAIVGLKKIDIECDGFQHEIVDGIPVVSDVRRDQYLSDRGWTVLRFPNYRIDADPVGVVEEILSSLK